MVTNICMKISVYNNNNNNNNNNDSLLNSFAVCTELTSYIYIKYNTINGTTYY